MWNLNIVPYDESDPATCGSSAGWLKSGSFTYRCRVIYMSAWTNYESLPTKVLSTDQKTLPNS